MTEVKRKTIDKFEVLSGMFLLVLLGLILVTAGLSGEQVFLVVAGFFPTILTILVSLTMHENYAQRNKVFWFIPIIIVGAFYFIGTGSTVFGNINVELLTGINLIISLIYVAIVFGLFSEKHMTTSSTKEQATQPKHKEETIEDFINSIEDKSKALNFVVGRVYNKYHGGELSIRDKLRIPAEWYNEFSNIGVGTNKIDFNKLDEIITKFELQLKNFEKTESELFKTKANALKNLIRDPNGADKIIDVLDHNDKDPVRSYYQGALDFCKKIRDSMKDQKIKLVKNTYIPTKEEDIAELKEKQKEISKSNGPKVTVEEPKGPKHP
ncbi:hypothetical protein JXA48_05260 [Candidatus Woesearchaeota archaeon]|nr:hypothetical protein [Candidatus Woesearchaeota archaeon]